jgi:hypothetical protein
MSGTGLTRLHREEHHSACTASIGRRIATTPYTVAHRAVLRPDVRNRTPDSGPQEMLHARPAKGQSAGVPAAAAAADAAQAEAEVGEEAEAGAAAEDEAGLR